MKYLYTWLIISLGIAMPLSSQTLISWPLSTSHLGHPTVNVNEVTGISFDRGNGIGILNYTGSGVSARNWASALIDEAQVDYYEFGLQAHNNQTIEIDEIAFSERRSSTGPRDIALVYSLDNFTTEVLTSVINLPDNISSRSHSIPLNIKIADGEQLRFRLYAYNSESPNGSWTIIKNTLQVTGHAMTACSSPTNAAVVNIISTGTDYFEAEITGGNGQGRLILIGPEQAEFPAPYQGDAYIGNTTYGQGDCIAWATHVIRSTTDGSSTITVDGLEEGGFYQMAIFEYNLADMCYSTNPTITDIMTSCSSIPKALQSIQYTSLDGRIAMEWQELNCFDKYLIVASKQPITGAPSGISFEEDPDFGEGDAPNGFGPNIYPVFYAGNTNQAFVRGLTNGTPYYFAIYTRVGAQWSAAYQFEVTPKEACSGHLSERIFLNEIHYVNSIVSQDQGIEIAGPAGIDLSNYEIFYATGAGGVNNVYYNLHKIQLRGLIDDEGDGYGAVWFPEPNLSQQRGIISLINKITEEVVDRITYGPGIGLNDLFGSPSNPTQGGNYFNLFETNFDPAGYSLQRTGAGHCAIDYVWYKIPHSRGTLNVGQLILPVVLTELAAEAKGEAARVYWQTIAEENSDYFIIEHSTDGRTFKQLGKVKASGFSQVFVDYQFWDYTPAKGINYYRLKQQDFDGTIHDHGIVTVSFDGDGKETLLVFPNPVDRQATITWQGKAEVLKLSDSQGRLLRTIRLDEYAEGGSRSMDLSNLPQGAYFLRLEGRDRVETFTVVKR